MLPKPLQELSTYFEKFPGIGPRQASRFSFFLMKQPQEKIDAFVAALTALKKEIILCSRCHLPMERDAGASCPICADKKRNGKLIFIVEKESDAINMEKLGKHNGKYLVLGENISALHESKTAKQRIKAFLKDISAVENAEIVLALNNTREGNFTSLYMQEALKNAKLPNIKITRLGRGLSTGSELEYADEETLRNALEGRK